MVVKPFTVSRGLLLAALLCAVFALLAATGAFALFGWSVGAWLCATLVCWLASQLA